MKPKHPCNFVIANRNRKRAGERGSILVICMVLAGLGTLGTAAFFSLMDAKMMESEQMNTANERRAKRANSLALAKEIVQRKYIAAGTGPVTAETHTLPGGWGECTISPFIGAPMGSTAATRTHRTGATPYRAYSYDIAVQIDDGDIKHPRQFQIKSFNPMLGGDLLYMGQPTIDGAAVNTLSGNVNVKGRARLWTGGSRHNVTIKADRYVGVDPATPALALNNTSNQPVIAQNFLFPNTTAGRHGGSPTAAFDGTSSAIVNGDTPWNTYATKIADLGGTSIDGTTPFFTSDAAETNPPTTDDLSLIAQVSSLGGGALRNALWPFRPVSSDVLRAVIARQDTLADGIYANILIDHSPLPRDIMQLVIDGTVVMGANNLWWVYNANPMGVWADGAGTVGVDLDESTATHLLITNDVTTVQLKGQEDAADFAAAATLDPLILVVHNTAASTKILSQIEFQGPNNRPIILAIKNENSNATVNLIHTGSNFPDWRMLAHLENVPISGDLSGVNSVTLKGGIWTDRSFELPNGSLTIERESDPGDLEWMTSRVAWLEVFRQ